MICTVLQLRTLLTGKILIGILFAGNILFMAFASARAETVIAHANVVWEMTDVVVQENTSLCWKVEKDDVWSFNPKLFPNGHTADGIPIDALKDYVQPGQPIGKLFGRIGDYGRIFPMGISGSIRILPSEDGEFLYLSMNDDIIGLYGKGFKDNKGELIVKINQTKEK
ncbi:MAG: hypothetical protein L3J17_03950 [Candidatus Jettenia sp.]|nr:MAG: hypothetical protein L3J17_03950 [Candidatus Jettenia sp.]